MQLCAAGKASLCKLCSPLGPDGAGCFPCCAGLNTCGNASCSASRSIASHGTGSSSSSDAPASCHHCSVRSPASTGALPGCEPGARRGGAQTRTSSPSSNAQPATAAASPSAGRLHRAFTLTRASQPAMQPCSRLRSRERHCPGGARRARAAERCAAYGRGA